MTEPTPPLTTIRLQLALPVGENAVFDGWTSAAVDNAAAALSVEPAVARLAFPDEPSAMIDAYLDGVDDALGKAFGPGELDALKVSARIRAILRKRFEIMAPAREAVRAAMAILARPDRLPRAAALGWRSADRMWRLAGDRSTDFNHYSKRATLGAIYAATLLVWLDDASEDLGDTMAFLDRRLAGVGRFEKAKAQWLGSAERRPSVTRFLGRLRYPPH